MRKLALARFSYQDDFLISYHIFMMTGPFDISLFEGTLHVDKITCDSKSQTLRMGYPCQSTGGLISYWNWWSFRVYIIPLQDFVLEWNSRPGTRTGGVNSRRGDSRWHDILWWYHVNKYRAMRGNRSELAPGRKSLCTLYVNCFILSFASNRQEMVPACFVVGVVKHWMQTDVHVHVS